MRKSVVVVVLGALAGAGCAHQGAIQPPPATPPGSAAATSPFQELPSTNRVIVTPETELVGRVVSVNTSGRFVVLNFPIGHLPVLGQRLAVYRLGLKVGEVKVSGPQQEDNVVADIVAGDAQVGDTVRPL